MLAQARASQQPASPTTALLGRGGPMAAAAGGSCWGGCFAMVRHRPRSEIGGAAAAGAAGDSAPPSALPSMPAGAVAARNVEQVDGERLRRGEITPIKMAEGPMKLLVVEPKPAALEDQDLDEVPQRELPTRASTMPEVWAPLSIPNKGSATHGTGACRPCAWYWKPKTCLNGEDGAFWHLCPEGELKTRKKAKLTAMRTGGLTPKAMNGSDRGSPHVLQLSSLI